MPSANFTIPGPPKGKARARTCFSKGRVRTYTPKDTQNYETMIKTLAYEAMRGRPPVAVPVTMEVDAYAAVPASWSIKKCAAATVWAGKPDCDNTLKTVADGCNQIIYLDDKQIVKAVVTKQYSDIPRVEVRVYWEDMP